MNTLLSITAIAVTTATLAVAAPAAAKAGDPVKVSDDLTIDPIIDGMLRWEHVDQANPDLDADAVTLRMRAGAELSSHGFSFLAEAEGTLAISDNYNDTIPGNNGYRGAEPYSVVADPENVELNRLQIAYGGKWGKVTVGRQLINMDNQRFVGAVAWRQNEQTFDAVRGEFKAGPIAIDAVYSNSQRTVFGIDSPNSHFDGDLVLLNGGVDLKTVKVKAFTYLLDWDRLTRQGLSSQTYGVLAVGAIPLGSKAKLNFLGSYALQSDYAGNPVNFKADYINAELGASIMGFGLKGGYEKLGSDNGRAAFQTPLATLHAFNGWADLFLTTPADGIQDYYGGLTKALGNAGPLKGMSAAVVYHKFESDNASIDYGTEWDASLGFKVSNYAVLLKYANYNADRFGTDTEKFWLQVGFSY